MVKAHRAQVLIDGQWQESAGKGQFVALNPTTLKPLEEEYPISDWTDCDRVLSAAWNAAEQLRRLPRTVPAEFLEIYAGLIESNAQEIVQLAHAETALAVTPRLADVELPRTAGQLRQAAQAARTGSWALPTIDTSPNIRSCYLGLGPVAVFGPNNFPLAFGSVSGNDFAAAIASGNPVIGKANTSHPGTTRKLAELANQAAKSSGMPKAAVQLIYRLEHQDGFRLITDSRMAAVGYTGSRSAGLRLKAAADAVGKPIYLELSSINPVILLPEALEQSCDQIVNEFCTSALMGTGQFCTNPGLIIMLSGPTTDRFLRSIAEKFKQSLPGTLLSLSVQSSLTQAIETLTQAGAELICGGQTVEGCCSVTNTLLTVSGERFLESPETFQTEAFGNASLIVVADSVCAIQRVIQVLEGNLTGCIYSARDGADDTIYEQLAPLLVQRVGRLLNDKMPTGVAVSPAMQHGGPFPATGHPGFTAVGIPASLLRFAKLTCFDNVRHERLPDLLRDKNPTGRTWRMIDLKWTTSDI